MITFHRHRMPKMHGKLLPLKYRAPYREIELSRLLGNSVSACTKSFCISDIQFYIWITRENRCSDVSWPTRLRYSYNLFVHSLFFFFFPFLLPRYWLRVCCLHNGRIHLSLLAFLFPRVPVERRILCQINGEMIAVLTLFHRASATYFYHDIGILSTG